MLLVLPALCLGYKQAREGRGPKSLVSVSNGVELLSIGLRALERLQSLMPLMGHPTFPFIVQGKGKGYTREREKKKEKAVKTRALEPCCSSSPIGRSHWSCRSWRGRLHVAVLFVIGATGGCRQQVAAFHSVPVHGMVNRLP
jgi:hypothetical protein